MLLLQKIALLAVASGYITFYNPIGKTLSCLRVMGEPKWKWKYHGKRTGIAHRWLPCGTDVYVKVGKKFVKTKVVDRGPYGALDVEGKFVVASPNYLKKWWRKEYEKEGKTLTEDEESRLAKVLPKGWKWRCVADILYTLKPKLKTKGGRQPGIVAVSDTVWQQVKDLKPENEEFLVPPDKEIVAPGCPVENAAGAN